MSLTEEDVGGGSGMELLIGPPTADCGVADEDGIFGVMKTGDGDDINEDGVSNTPELLTFLPTPLPLAL